MDAVRGEILTEEQLRPLAVVAVSTQLGIVRRHAVADAQIPHRLSDRDDDPGRLVARHDGHFGREIPIVDVQVRAAYAAGFDCLCTETLVSNGEPFWGSHVFAVWR